MFDPVQWIQAALLGVVEGLTEFLPVSSTGHLILLVDLLRFAAPPGKSFEIIIQLGAILAVMVAFAPKILRLLKTLPTQRESQHFAACIVVAFLPAMLVGAWAHDFIRNVLFDPRVVSAALIVGGVVILLVERQPRKNQIVRMEAMSLRTALGIGALQCFAMIPGVSRSGATIIGGLMLGLERRAAAEFSFFLAIPTMLGAAAYSLYKNFALLAWADAGLIAVGFIFAFVSALIVARGFIAFVGRYGLSPFAWYRIILGAGMLAIFI